MDAKELLREARDTLREWMEASINDSIKERRTHLRLSRISGAALAKLDAALVQQHAAPTDLISPVSSVDQGLPSPSVQREVPK